jgi:hypothetical protein
MAGHNNWMDGQAQKFTSVCPFYSLCAKAHKKTKQVQNFSNMGTKTDTSSLLQV